MAAGQSVDASERDGDARWLPGFSLYSTGHLEDRVARISSDTSPAKAADSRGLPWSVGVGLDLVSPVVLDAPGRPRLFGRAEVGYTFDLYDPVASEGNPNFPPFVPPSTRPTATAIENVGSALRVEAKPLVLSGGIGTQFQFEAFDRGFRFRPSLEWMYRRDTIKTVLGGGETEAASGDVCTPCRLLFIKAQTEKGFHALGPGVELEADVGRVGQFMVGFYGSFRAYYLVGDRKANFTSTGSWQRTDNQPTNRADTAFVTRYEREPWQYRFGMGLHIFWSPE